MEEKGPSVEMLTWLNERNEIEEKAWLLVLVRFVLKKISSEGSVKLDKDGVLPVSFWKKVEMTLGYELLQQRQRPIDIHLYQFIQQVAVVEGWLIFEEGKSKVTEKAILFLEQPAPNQLESVLNYFWPQS